MEVGFDEREGRCLKGARSKDFGIGSAGLWFWVRMYPELCSIGTIRYFTGNVNRPVLPLADSGEILGMHIVSDFGSLLARPPYLMVI